MEETDHYYETTHLGKQITNSSQWEFDINGLMLLGYGLMLIVLIWICESLGFPSDYANSIGMGIAIISLLIKLIAFRKIVYENGVGCWKFEKLDVWLPWETCTKVVFENDDGSFRTHRQRWYKKRYFVTVRFPNQKPINIEYEELAFLIKDWKHLIEMNPVLEKKIKFSSLTLKERQEMKRLGFNYHSNV